MYPYINYVTPYISSYAEKSLMISDAMGYIDDPDFIIDRNYFNNHLIMYTMSGCLIVEQYGSQYRIYKGQGILMDLRQPHKYYFSGHEKTKIIWMHFRGAPCGAMLDTLCEQHSLPFTFRGGDFPTGFETLQSAVAETQLPDESEISAIIYSIVTDVCGQVHEQDSDYAGSFTASAARYVMTHIDEKISLDNFASFMDMSKYHFCRRFKEEFACTPFEYIQKQKINKAKRILLFTNLPLSEIACSLSFCDQSHFSRVFTKEVGITPLKYRNNPGNSAI